jgi:sulfite oxidase
MRIGTLKDYDPNKTPKEDPYINDPVRSSELVYQSYAPCNAETPVKEIVDNWITPNDIYFIRSHHPVPVIDPKT